MLKKLTPQDRLELRWKIDQLNQNGDVQVVTFLTHLIKLINKAGQPASSSNILDAFDQANKAASATPARQRHPQRCNGLGVGCLTFHTKRPFFSHVLPDGAADTVNQRQQMASW